MYLNVIQLAESLGVEESAVDGLIRKDGLPCIHDCGRLLFDRSQVAAWAAQRGLTAKAGFLAAEESSRPVHLLERLLASGGIWRDLSPEQVLPTIEQLLGRLPAVTPEVGKLLSQRLRAPGSINWAPIGAGLALPHLRARVSLGRETGLLAILLLKTPIPVEPAPDDGVAVDRLLFFLAPTPRAHLEILAQLSAALTKGNLQSLLRVAALDDDLRAAIRAADQTAASKATEAAR